MIFVLSLHVPHLTCFGVTKLCFVIAVFPGYLDIYFVMFSVSHHCHVLIFKIYREDMLIYASDNKK